MEITSQDFLLFYGIITLIAAVSILVFQRSDHQPSSKQSARQTMQLVRKIEIMISTFKVKGFYSNPNLKLFSLFLLIWQFGFSMVESVWMFQMLERVRTGTILKRINFDRDFQKKLLSYFQQAQYQSKS